MAVSTFTGAKAIGTAIVTASTGSPTIDTTSRPSKTIYKFTGSGSITIATGGMAEMLVIGGGGAAGSDNSGGGAGGYVYDASVFLPAGTLTVTVGSGGTSSESGSISYVQNGNPSRLGSYVALGGGASGFTQDNASWRVGFDGGSGGGGASNFYAGGSAQLGQGNNGSNNHAGGGAGAAGGSGGIGGAGLANSITGTSVTYAGGGGGISQVGGAGGGGNSGATGQDGTANTGGGAGGSYSGGVTKNGGSGYVVVVV